MHTDAKKCGQMGRIFQPVELGNLMFLQCLILIISIVKVRMGKLRNKRFTCVVHNVAVVHNLKC